MRTTRTPIARHPYPSDATEAQWHAIESLLPPSDLERAREQGLDLREVVNAIQYVQRSGCRWAMLPHDFPPWGTVHSHFRRWRSEGVWDRVLGVLDSEGAAREPQEPVGVPADKTVAEKFSPLNRLRVVQMCPYLGSRSDRMTRRAYPSTQNVCRANTDRYRKVDSHTQDELCLGDNHAACEHYKAHEKGGGVLGLEEPEDVGAGEAVAAAANAE